MLSDYERVAHMTTAQKIVGGAVLIGVVTAATLPGRQTVPALKATQGLVQGETNTLIEG
jgi:hypothetical protein